VRLRPTREGDLDLVLSLERDPENAPFIGQWPREEHRATIAAADREHWIVQRAAGGARIGYLIARDLGAANGVYVQRIVIEPKSEGLGRAALRVFCRHAFLDLGAAFVWLSVFRRNLRGQRAYRAAGFGDFSPPAAQRDDLRRAAGFSADSLLFRIERESVLGPNERP
jgi:RimJ/RimL family protein N-acetyltransferase